MMVVSGARKGANLAANWRWLLLEAALIVGLVLALFYFWFGIADRYAIFLYGHATFGVPAEPFDELTSSRYWMSGLVAAGAVMVLYITANWFLRQLAIRRNKHFVPSIWWQVWIFSAVPISIGIPAITMTVNSPTLPFSLALMCVASTLSGLAIALLPGRWAAECPVELVWLGADGIGLMPPLLLLHAVEFPRVGSRANSAVIWLLVVATILIGVVWLAGLTLLRLWRHKKMPTAGALFLAGIALSYLLMPLIHYLIFAPSAYRYISAAENFFARNLGLQLLALVIAGVLAWGVTRVRLRFKK